VRPKDVPTHIPAALTTAEAETIGRGLESIARLSATHIDAINELLLKYPALAVTAQQRWFRSMLEAIAKQQTATRPLGLKLRLAIGAAFSIGDMASDAMQIATLFLAGQSLRAVALLAMIAMNLAAQMLIIIVQTAHRGWRVVLWELSLVFSLLKPAIDVIDVAGGDERVESAPVDPLAEMMFCEVSDMAFESIPPRRRRVDHVGGRFGHTVVRFHRAYSYQH
jgi:hypothetical protein